MTKAHLALVSKVAVKLLQAGNKCEQMLQIGKASSHTTPSSETDIQSMVKILLEGDVVDKGDRLYQGGKFFDPRREGILKMENGWLRDFCLENLKFVPK